jgi:hypothetical protein
MSPYVAERSPCESFLDIGGQDITKKKRNINLIWEAEARPHPERRASDQPLLPPPTGKTDRLVSSNCLLPHIA